MKIIIKTKQASCAVSTGVFNEDGKIKFIAKGLRQSQLKRFEKAIKEAIE